MDFLKQDENSEGSSESSSAPLKESGVIETSEKESGLVGKVKSFLATREEEKKNQAKKLQYIINKQTSGQNTSKLAETLQRLRIIGQEKNTPSAAEGYLFKEEYFPQTKVFNDLLSAKLELQEMLRNSEQLTEAEIANAQKFLAEVLLTISQQYAENIENLQTQWMEYAQGEAEELRQEYKSTLSDYLNPYRTYLEQIAKEMGLNAEETEQYISSAESELLQKPNEPVALKVVGKIDLPGEKTRRKDTREQKPWRPKISLEKMMDKNTDAIDQLKTTATTYLNERSAEQMIKFLQGELQKQDIGDFEYLVSVLRASVLKNIEDTIDTKQAMSPGKFIPWLTKDPSNQKTFVPNYEYLNYIKFLRDLKEDKKSSISLAPEQEAVLKGHSDLFKVYGPTSYYDYQTKTKKPTSFYRDLDTVLKDKNLNNLRGEILNQVARNTEILLKEENKKININLGKGKKDQVIALAEKNRKESAQESRKKFINEAKLRVLQPLSVAEVLFGNKEKAFERLGKFKISPAVFARAQQLDINEIS